MQQEGVGADRFAIARGPGLLAAALQPKHHLADPGRDAEDLTNETNRGGGRTGRWRDRPLNLGMLEEIDADTFASKNRALRERTADLQLEIEACDRGRNEIIDIAVKAFELSQNFVSGGLRLTTLQNVMSSKSSV